MKEEAQKSPAKNVVEFREICKYFPGVRALDRISFRAESGQVYAFVGENGAGKSTLLKILNGDYTMTSGEVLLNGREQHFTCPKDAIEAGISVIYQERQVILDMTVAENVFLGSWARGKDHLIDYGRMLAETRKVIEEFGVSIDPAARVRTLSTAHQQMVEIMKAYIRNAKVIAFDEPTASLTDNEIDVLFRIIRKLRAQGKIVFYVSHRMKEVLRISDEIFVLKDGELVTELDAREATEELIVKHMVGRNYDDYYHRKRTFFGAEAMRLENVGGVEDKESRGAYTPRGVSLSLYEGEVLGIAGLVGAGRTELIRLIFGEDEKAPGSRVFIFGKEARIRSSKDAMRQGLAWAHPQVPDIGQYCAAEPGPPDAEAVCRQEKRAGALRNVYQKPEHPDHGDRAAGDVSFGRQPTEGGAGQMARDAAENTHSRRADPRNRRGREGGGL